MTKKIETNEFVVLIYPDQKLISIRSKNSDGFISWPWDLHDDVINIMADVRRAIQ